MSAPKAKEVQVRVEIVKLNKGDTPVPDVEDIPLDVNATAIDLTNLRATKLPDLSRLHQLQKLTFRQNWLTSFSYLPPAPPAASDAAAGEATGAGSSEAPVGVEGGSGGGGCPHLTELDLYENKIASLEGCVFPPGLVTLDLSFNELKHTGSHLRALVHLRELYLPNNKLKKLEGLEGLTRLRLLELGSNHLREIDPHAQLPHVANTLEELWLGRNKISELGTALRPLTKLKKLSVQSNRLTAVGPDALLANTQLRELYLSQNGLSGAPAGLGHLLQLQTLDLAGNQLTTLLGVGLENLQQLTELWLNDNQLGEWEGVEPVLRALAASLETVYLERNPLQKLQPPHEYTQRVRSAVPKLQQLDATLF